jgi:SAM-dependent methyltransferase
MRQTLVVSGVRYRELTTEPLRRALSRKGSGHKDYDAVFADGSGMRIRCTPQRIYADLTPSPRMYVCDHAGPLLRPGMRVLLLGGGTGDAGARLARLVAPSGAVVSLDSDAESVEYAQRRYPLRNISFEAGGIDGLAGETDGAFNAVLAIDPSAAPEDPDRPLRELWRVVASGGLFIIAAPAGSAADELVGRLGSVAALPEAPTVLADGRESWVIAAAARPAEDAPARLGPRP